MQTSRCFHHGDGFSTVPRHECQTASCEFDRPEEIIAEIRMWEEFERDADLPPDSFAGTAKRKLEFANKLAEGLDKAK